MRVFGTVDELTGACSKYFSAISVKQLICFSNEIVLSSRIRLTMSLVDLVGAPFTCSPVESFPFFDDPIEGSDDLKHRYVRIWTMREDDIDYIYHPSQSTKDHKLEVPIS